MNDTALSPSANDLLTQLATGPSLREVAAATLRSALAELYPDLDIDPNLAILVTPRWQSVSGEVVPDLPHLQSLAGALARSALTNVALTWIDGEHYLINQTQEQANTHVSVQVDRIAQLINELAPPAVCLLPGTTARFLEPKRRPERATLEDLGPHTAQPLECTHRR